MLLCINTQVSTQTSTQCVPDGSTAISSHSRHSHFPLTSVDADSVASFVTIVLPRLRLILLHRKQLTLFYGHLKESHCVTVLVLPASDDVSKPRRRILWRCLCDPLVNSRSRLMTLTLGKIVVWGDAAPWWGIKSVRWPDAGYGNADDLSHWRSIPFNPKATYLCWPSGTLSMSVGWEACRRVSVRPPYGAAVHSLLKVLNRLYPLYM